MEEPVYLAKDLSPWRNPIYDAPFPERLKDLIQSAEAAKTMLQFPDLIRQSSPAELEREGLKEGEFAIGNWIVRPRFPVDNPP